MNETPCYQFRLYITGDAANSRLAVENLRSICKTHFKRSPKIEIVNLLDQPARALLDHILLTPTLVKVSPEPEQRIIGNLSDTLSVLRAIGPSGVS